MTEIVASVQRVTDIIGEISAAAASRPAASARSTARSQLDQMTQQNAALVEQRRRRRTASQPARARPGRAGGSPRPQARTGDHGRQRRLGDLLTASRAGFSSGARSRYPSRRPVLGPHPQGANAWR
jgi:hypothetical protein